MTTRLATADDIAVLAPLMAAAIEVLQKGFIDEEQIESSKTITGIDRQLIEDGTYFVVEIDGTVAGCGGCSRRATLYGGDHSAGRDAARLTRATDQVRVRAMYPHPDFARRGVGRLLLETCVTAAAAEGFTAHVDTRGSVAIVTWRAVERCCGCGVLMVTLPDGGVNVSHGGDENVTLKMSAVMLGVEDLTRSKAFYAEGLGCSIANDYPQFVSLDLGEGSSTLALYPREGAARDAAVSPEGSGFRGVSFHFIVDSNDEVDEVIGKAVAAGGSIVRDAADAKWGGYFGYFADPDGYLWKVATAS